MMNKYRRLEKISLGWHYKDAHIASFIGRRRQVVSYWKHYRPRHYEALVLGFWAEDKQIPLKNKKVHHNDLASFLQVQPATVRAMMRKQEKIYRLIKKGYIIIDNYETHKLYSKVN